MEAKLKNRGGITVISVSGRLEIEKTQPFRDACMKNLVGKKIVFDLNQVNFVGSTGIQPFFETVKALNENSLHGVKLVSVKPELRKILSHIDCVEFHENEDGAVQSFDRPKPAPTMAISPIESEITEDIAEDLVDLSSTESTT